VIRWPEGARSLVERARVARLATCGADAAPHIVPICFVVSGDRLYSVVDEKPKRTRTALKRLRNLRENPRAAVLVDHYEEDWGRLAYAMLRGEATEVTDPSEYAAALASLRAKYPQYRSMDLVAGRNPMLRLAIEKVVYWRGGSAE
jgi:PPOX class probable F420-dependent enzyme